MAAGVGLITGDLMSVIMLGTTEVLQPRDYAILCALVAAVAVAILRTIYVLPEGGRIPVLRAWGTAATVAVIFAFVPGAPTILFAGLLLAVIVCLAQLGLLTTDLTKSP